MQLKIQLFGKWFSWYCGCCDQFNLYRLKQRFSKAHDICNTIRIIRFGMFGTEVSTAFYILKGFLLGDEILIQIFLIINIYTSVNKLVMTFWRENWFWVDKIQIFQQSNLIQFLLSQVLGSTFAYFKRRRSSPATSIVGDNQYQR